MRSRPRPHLLEHLSSASRQTGNDRPGSRPARFFVNLRVRRQNNQTSAATSSPLPPPSGEPGHAVGIRPAEVHRQGGREERRQPPHLRRRRRHPRRCVGILEGSDERRGTPGGGGGRRAAHRERTPRGGDPASSGKRRPPCRRSNRRRSPLTSARCRPRSAAVCGGQATRPARPSRPGPSFRKPEDLLPLLPAAPAALQAGDRPLAGVDWELEELLGVGGFGEVWKARNPHFDGMAPVALKFCLDPAAKERLLKHEAARHSTRSCSRASTKASCRCCTPTSAPTRRAWPTSTSTAATWPG